MTTDALMALISKKVPKNTADIQALRDKFNKFDDKERDELAEQIKYEIAGANLKAAAFAFLGGLAFGVFVYFGITHEWFSRYFFDRFGIDAISDVWKEIYDAPGSIILFMAVFSALCAVWFYFDLPNEDRKKNLDVINELITQKALNKR